MSHPSVKVFSKCYHDRLVLNTTLHLLCEFVSLISGILTPYLSSNFFQVRSIVALIPVMSDKYKDFARNSIKRRSYLVINNISSYHAIFILRQPSRKSLIILFKIYFSLFRFCFKFEERKKERKKERMLK